jgi:hypothetical protein
MLYRARLRIFDNHIVLIQQTLLEAGAASAESY